MTTEYTIEYFTADIGVDEYIERFRDEARFIELCEKCPNFGCSWGCPPFDFDTDEFLRQYKYAHLMATKIIPDRNDIPVEMTQEFIRPERVRIEKELLEMERKYGGRGFAYVGKCLYCSGSECTRKRNRPCLHPDKVRPSLEAFGFDIGRTLSELFGIRLLWGKDGILPLPRWLLTLLDVLINLLRSVPFLILMIMVIPLTRVIVPFIVIPHLLNKVLKLYRLIFLL